MPRESIIKSRLFDCHFRVFLYPFLFVFCVILCSLSIPFSKAGINFGSLVSFCLFYALIFSVPFLLDRLLLRFSTQDNHPKVFEGRTWKLLYISLVATLFIAVTAFTAKSAALQISNAGLLANSVSAATGSLFVISALFIGLFSFTFYFTEPATDSLTSKI